MSKPLALYIHFPFCKKKCRYCDFLSFPSLGRTDIYMDALMNELRTIPAALLKHHDYMITSIFIGGGTPSLMSPDWLKALMDLLHSYPISATAEITMECNPGTLSSKMLLAMSASGINRISIGLQSTDNQCLLRLGRIHTYEQFKENFYEARNLGFNNINIDLMSALPGQSLSDYETDLNRIISLKPEHISAYSLIIEEGTPFFDYYEENKNIDITLPPLPSEDDERLMYHRTKEILKSAGYHRYEISNYALKGFECSHNTAYWKRQDYLGLGLGASSLIENTRFSVTSDFDAYIRYFQPNQFVPFKACPPYDDIHTAVDTLSVKAQMEEFMFLGLRLTSGIRLSDFKKAFGKNIFEIYGPVINTHIHDGTLVLDADSQKLSLTEHGLDISNFIMADFLLE